MVMTNPIFENEADILAQTYYHTATIKRPKHTTRGYFDDYKEEIVYEDIPCAISFTQGSTEDLTDTTQPIQYIAKLFARPEIEVKEGDIVLANVLGHDYEFRAGEGYSYQSHIEVPLIRNEDA